MRAMRVPRSGGMILSMFVALVATMLLPMVFMVALTSSAESHPKPMLQTIKDVSRPFVLGVEHVIDRLR